MNLYDLKSLSIVTKRNDITINLKKKINKLKKIDQNFTHFQVSKYI